MSDLSLLERCYLNIDGSSANSKELAYKYIGLREVRMELGICVASHINDIEYVVRAEELGYSHAWMADSQMLWSDCYATLALVASRTSHIKIGTGVAVSSTRPAPVNAAGIATINAIAPGRTFLASVQEILRCA